MNISELKDLCSGLPGEELIVPGIDHALATQWTPEALLLFIAKDRLIRSGFEFLESIEAPFDSIEFALYDALEERRVSNTYGAYNSWKRRLDSFIRALETRVKSEKGQF